MQQTMIRGWGKTLSKKAIIIISCVAGVFVIAAIAAVIIAAVFIVGRFARRGGEENAYAEYEYETPAGAPRRPHDAAQEFSDFTIAPTALGGINIEALDTTEFGIAVDSGFIISSQTQVLTAEHLNSYLSSRCGKNFTVEEQTSGVFLLQFSQEPEPNAIINLVYEPPGYAAASHAFQTADIFRVTATTPARNTHGIPVNTGIEITFNKPLAGGIAAFEEAFSIYPPAEGRFLQRENIYIFAPELEFGRNYTVTIRQGLESVTGDVLAEDFSFAFTTQWGTATARPFSILGNAYETFLPWNEVFVAINISSEFRWRDFVINVYDLQTYENFINFEGTETGVHIGEFEMELAEFQGGHSSFFYLFLGQPLPEGYYVLEIQSTEPGIHLTAYKFIQVSPISVYSISVDAESVFWVHDASSGEPAQGARIIIDGTTAGVTNSEGVAVVDTTENRRAEITIEYAQYLPFAYTKPTFAPRTPLPFQRFLSYIYTDRPQYRPNDTIDVFGVIKPLYGHAHSADDVFTLRIGRIFEMPLELDAHYSFAVRIPVENMFGHSDITVEVNGERLMSAWISFFDYTNLVFVITGELDRIAYDAGDYAHAEILLTTFAGRPAEGIALSRGQNEPNIVTDENGLASGNIPIYDWTRATNWHPRWSSFWFSVAGVADVSQSISLSHIVVPRNVMLEHELDGSELTVYTNEILTDRINEEYQNARAWTDISPDTFRGAPVDIDFRIEVTRYVTTRTIRHQQYDHINRRMITTYNFNTTSSLYRTIPARTENGRTVVTDIPVSDDPMIRYRFEIRYYDTRGRETVVWVHTGWWHTQQQESSIRFFNFSVENRNLTLGETTMVSIIEVENEWYWGWYWYGSQAEGATVPDGRMIAVLVRDGVISAQTGPTHGVPVTFTEAAISNAILFGAFFDGQYIFPINNSTPLNFDHTARELEIELSFDRENYSPGDEVTITIQTSRQAQVLISVVDESSFQGMWHTANFLTRLYNSALISRWDISVYQFASHRQHNFGGAGEGAEGGGNGDGGYGINFRDFFVDNPIFETVQTDANGLATFTFTLPDQITSWRVTALGLSQDGFAGDTRENIISYLDFYADLLFTNEYIVGDDIAVLARAFGVAGPVDFTFNVLRGGETIFSDSHLTTTGRAVFNAGKLPAGEYTMQLIAVTGMDIDAVEKPFSVAHSGLIMQNRASVVISPESPNGFSPDEFNMRNLPVHVTLTNANIRPLTRILFGASNSRSFRTDYIAGAAFRDYFFRGEVDVYAVRARVQADSGGIPELTYEYADLFYTARFVTAFPEFVDRDRVLRYIERELAEHDTPVRRAAALLARAGLGEPVLLQIRDEAENMRVNDVRVISYLAAALVAVGDDAGAAQLLTIETNAPVHLTAVEQQTVSTLRFFINTAINPEAAWAHVNRGYANQYVSDAPERINFVRRVRLRGDTVSEFSYFHNGQTHTARLENFDRLHLQLTHGDFLALNVTPTVGETNFHVDFYGYDSTGWDSADERIQISRTITRDGDLYRVELTVVFPHDAYGSFTIYDRIPSNMRHVPLRRNHTPGQPWFSVRPIQRQLMEANLFLRRGDQNRTRVVYYHVMELFEGDMAPGTTYITNRRLDNHLWGSTQ